MKIVVTDAKTIASNNDFFEPLKKFGELKLYDLSSPEELPDRIWDADIILCNKNVYNESNLKYATRLKYIGLFATGYNNIDIEYTTAKGICVCNAGPYSTMAVAQHTFALILNFFSSIGLYNDFVKNGGWQESEVFSPFIFSMKELAGKTIGIVGFGNIGQKVAKIAFAFGMNVLSTTRTKKEAKDVQFTDLDTLISKSDVVTVHCPLNKESEKMFNKSTFSKFKKEAFFVNTARGAIVEEEALVWALNNDIIAGAAIDCLDIEPMSRECLLRSAKNITITPHVAWAMEETRERLLGIVCENIEKFLCGEPVNVIKK